MNNHQHDSEMNPKVSIIIPVYNSERYLPRCLNSVIGQTYRNLEIILINDGSNDRSGQICDEYAERDQRIKVKHQENGGVSSARNVGLDTATGKYLQFADCDDYLDTNMVEKMLFAINTNGAEVAICGLKQIDASSGRCLDDTRFLEEGLYGYDGFLLILPTLYSLGLTNAPWNKIYRTSFIRAKSIRFEEEMDYGEDLMFNMDVFKKGHSFQLLAESLYNYVQYNGFSTLASRRRRNMHEIQVKLFAELTSIYVNTTGNLDQLNALDKIHAEYVVRALLLTADSYTLKDYSSYKSHIASIVVDKALNDCFRDLSLQRRLVMYLIRHKWYLAVYILGKIKHYIKDRYPRGFLLVKKLIVRI